MELKNTLLMGKTNFEMRGNLSLKEPLMLKKWEENQIYKVGKHDAIIAKLNEIGVRLPTFDYKCELEEMLREIDIVD